MCSSDLCYDFQTQKLKPAPVVIRFFFFLFRACNIFAQIGLCCLLAYNIATSPVSFNEVGLCVFLFSMVSISITLQLNTIRYAGAQGYFNRIFQYNREMAQIYKSKTPANVNTYARDGLESYAMFAGVCGFLAVVGSMPLATIVLHSNPVVFRHIAFQGDGSLEGNMMLGFGFAMLVAVTFSEVHLIGGQIFIHTNADRKSVV